MSEEIGIKETKECFIAGNEIGIFILQRIKDGLGIDDALALVAKLTADAEFQKIIADAIDKVGLVPAEIKDFSVAEGLELATLQIGYVPRIIGALK